MFSSANKSKGTVTYLSDAVMAITTMISTVFMLFISALVIFIINTHVSVAIYGDTYYDTPLSGEALNVILDSQYQNFYIKDLIADAVWFNSDLIKVSGAKTIDLKAAVADSAGKANLQEYSAELEISGRKIPLASAGAKTSDKLKCSEQKIKAGVNVGTFTLCASRIGG